MNSNLGAVAAHLVLYKHDRHHWQTITHLGINIGVLRDLGLCLEDVQRWQNLTRKVVYVHTCDVILCCQNPDPREREQRIDPPKLGCPPFIYLRRQLVVCLIKGDEPVDIIWMNQ